MGELDTGPMSDTLNTRYDIVGVLLQDMELIMKISTTRPCSMMERVLLALGEVDLSLVPALLPPIIQLIMVDNLVLIVMVIT